MLFSALMPSVYKKLHGQKASSERRAGGQYKWARRERRLRRKKEGKREREGKWGMFGRALINGSATGGKIKGIRKREKIVGVGGLGRLNGAGRAGPRSNEKRDI